MTRDNRNIPDISEWDKENDPIVQEQVAMLYEMLEGELNRQALEGFMIIAGRLVDAFGNHRTSELAHIFKTHTETGRAVLRTSLEHMNQWVGGYHTYETRYPVIAYPPQPAFPLFKIIGIDRLAPCLYRVLDSRRPVHGTKEPMKDYVIRTSRLPPVPIHTEPVLREKPKFHWCAHERWDSPDTTRSALQILGDWKTDCRLRATLPTQELAHSAYIPFSGEGDPEDSHLLFDRYYNEIVAQDHPELPGGGVQIGVEGSPLVDVLEEWDDDFQQWMTIWHRLS